MKNFIVGITGASGSLYAMRLIEELCKREYHVSVIMSQAACEVASQELSIPFSSSPEEQKASIQAFLGKDYDFTVYGNGDWNASPASGSSRHDGMVVIPCSMGTLSAIATGASENLLERAADVCLKEGRKLILVPRETPFSTLHLKNMLTLSEMGVRILPANPAFYHQPRTLMDLVDFIISRVLDQLGIENSLIRRWGSMA